MISCNPVVSVCKSPFYCNHLTIMLFACISRSPWLTVFINKGLFNMSHLVTRRETVLHSKCIEEWFYSRTHLTSTHHSHIILEIVVVWPTDISFYISG